MKNIYTAYNFSHFAIYLPKLIKVGGNLTKFCQKQKCSFFTHGEVPCRLYCRPTSLQQNRFIRFGNYHAHEFDLFRPSMTLMFAPGPCLHPRFVRFQNRPIVRVHKFKRTNVQIKLMDRQHTCSASSESLRTCVCIKQF